MLKKAHRLLLGLEHHSSTKTWIKQPSKVGGKLHSSSEHIVEATLGMQYNAKGSSRASTYKYCTSVLMCLIVTSFSEVPSSCIGVVSARSQRLLPDAHSQAEQGRGGSRECYLHNLTPGCKRNNGRGETSSTPLLLSAFPLLTACRRGRISEALIMNLSARLPCDRPGEGQGDHARPVLRGLEVEASRELRAADDWQLANRRGMRPSRHGRDVTIFSHFILLSLQILYRCKSTGPDMASCWPIGVRSGRDVAPGVARGTGR